MRIKFDFSIPDHIAILLGEIGVILFMIYGLEGVISYLRESDTILENHGTLIAGLLALGVGYYSIMAVHKQITDVQETRIEQTKDKARIFLGVVASYQSRVRDVLNNATIINNQHRTQYFTVPEFARAPIMENTIREFLNDASNMAGLPRGTTKFFLQLRMDVLGVEDVMDAIRHAIRSEDREQLGNAHMDALFDIVFRKINENVRTVNEFLESNSDLYP